MVSQSPCFTAMDGNSKRLGTKQYFCVPHTTDYDEWDLKYIASLPKSATDNPREIIRKANVARGNGRDG